MFRKREIQRLNHEIEELRVLVKRFNSLYVKLTNTELTLDPDTDKVYYLVDTRLMTEFDGLYRDTS